MSDPHIRAIALAIIRHPTTGCLLVFEGRDSTRDLVYHRPLGGGILFNETAADAAGREIREEIGIVVEPLATLGVTESFFVVGGVLRHEIALLVECRFVDETLYDRTFFPDLEGNDEHGLWRGLEEDTLLFPEALKDVLRN
ncbi:MULTISPECIES: NUDIX domain-containing protein [Rhizobium]|uniref:8-oxo-dGTP pyrophosphatase MutT (NUDIX family) n=1 Tax=Rhizobium paranaense TaxID=1650438 RepID=A0A7W8XMR1_9HYPH|nr:MULTISPECIES: NUDIX domain-containing protein [Rhizobium]MBB5572242.1 8-oxo-dGTP pyrophosphatase MutT (NUDIX family) [Rhizobium paranaense]PST63315.1 NUDIX hydrolase [Rhizobium sp. SEMIA4064]